MRLARQWTNLFIQQAGLLGTGMAIDQGALEGGIRLAQVRRTKKLLIAVQAVIAVIAVIALTIMGGDLQLKPLYFDIGAFLYFLILMAFIIAVESLIFRLLEVRYAKTDSAKYYMLKITTRRSKWVIAISAIVLLLVLIPFALDIVTDSISESGHTSGAVSFFNRDALGLTSVESITVHGDKGAEVLIITENNYLDHAGDLEMLRHFSEAYASDLSSGAELPLPPAPFGKYYIVAEGGDVDYTLYRSVSSFFMGFVTVFSVLFIITHAAWILYTTPLRKYYAEGAIYR